MMHVIVGTDLLARSNKRQSIFKHESYEELEWEEMSVDEIATLSSTPSLLGDTKYFLLTGALSDPEKGEEMIAISKGLMSSPHVFIFEEDKLLKKLNDALSKIGAKVQILSASKKEGSFNVFPLAHALSARDRKHLWILLMQALRSGIAPENITGILHWKVREMLTGTKSSSYSRSELISLSRDLVKMYHDAHRGLGDLGLLLERFVLTL